MDDITPDQSSKQNESEDSINVVESSIESELSTEGSKDENENRKERSAKKDKLVRPKTEFLDLPDSIITKILRLVPSPFERKPVVTKKRFCSPNVTNNGCKVHGSIAATCKRLHRLSCERKRRAKAKESIAQTVNLPIRSLEIPVGQEQLRANYGDVVNPAEKWTYCYNSIDKIISSSQWLRHLCIKEYFNTVHSTHLISSSLDTASKYCSQYDQLQTLKICSCEIKCSPSNYKKDAANVTVMNEELNNDVEPQACSSRLFNRHPGSIDWKSFSRFARSCGSNISTLEIDHLNFKGMTTSSNEIQNKIASKEEVEKDIRETFAHFKKLQNLTLRLTKSTKTKYDEESTPNITPCVLSCSVIQNNLRILKISLSDFPDEDNTTSIASSLSSCHKLEELSLRFAEQLSSRDLDAISTLPRLRRLGISKANKLIPSDIINSFSDTQSRFRALNSLSLVLCSGINVHSLEAILGASNDETRNGGRNLQDLDIYADNLEDNIIDEFTSEKCQNQSYLSYLKDLCGKKFAVNVTLLGVTPGALFKISNLEKLDNSENRNSNAWWSKLRQMRCTDLNKSEEFLNPEHDDEKNLPPSPPPEYSNFTVLDSNISCHIKSVPTVVLSAPSSSKCR